MLERHGLLATRDRPSSAQARPRRRRDGSVSTLRVLPLGGLGEIGKNMTVVEHDGRIVVVDVGLRFPTPGDGRDRPRAAGLRATCASASTDIEAIVVTHGHEDHLGALPWVLRELGARRAAGLRRPADDGDGALEARRAQAARRRADRGRPRRGVELGPFSLELIHMTHSIPDSSAVALARELGHGADHRRLQVRPDARSTASPPTSRGWPSSAREGVLLLCGDSTNADRAGLLAVGVGRRAAARGGLRALPRGAIVVTSFASNIHRVQQVIDAAAALDRKVALVGRSMRKNVAIGRTLGHIEVPDGHDHRAARDRRTSPTTAS